MSFILGLTGSIGMGKSTTADLLREAGITVHDADAAVHALYRGAAVGPIEEAFPGMTAGGVVDRQKLAAVVLGKPEALKRLPRPLTVCRKPARRARHPAAVRDRRRGAL